MTLRNFLLVAVILGLAFGLAFIFIPTQLTSLYGVTFDDLGIFVAQLYGAALVAFSILNWFARTLTDAHALRAVRLANLGNDAIGFVIALLAQIRGVGGVNALGWSTVLIYLLLALGFAYFQFIKPDTN